jgi:hypothetical protein
MAKSIAAVVERIRRRCLTLPAVTERLSHGTPAWFVRDRKSFVTVWPDGHHDDQFAHLWCAAPAGAQAALIAEAPHRYFRPPYVGHRGWLGVRPDGIATAADLDLDDLCEQAYRTVAPAALIAELDAR